MSRIVLSNKVLIPLAVAGVLSLTLSACGGSSGKQGSAGKPREDCAKAEPKTTDTRTAEPGKLAFSKDGDIYTMNPDGSEQANLTEDESGDDSYETGPAWSPDGKKIAFVSDREDYDPSIYVMNSDGTGVSQLTEGPGLEQEPRWSPDGEKIAYTDEGDGGFALSVVDSDGRNATTLRKGPSPGFIGMSDWSPDGSRIVFVVDRSNSGGEIDTHVMNEDGTCAKRLTDAPGDDGSARWSPDGEKILFGSNRNGGGIYTMNPDGTHQTRVLEAPPGVAGADTLRPAWSPGGKKIAWTAKYEGDVGSKIYVMNADGTGLTAIHNELEMATNLDWQPVYR